MKPLISASPTNNKKTLVNTQNLNQIKNKNTAVHYPGMCSITMK